MSAGLDVLGLGDGFGDAVYFYLGASLHSSDNSSGDKGAGVAGYDGVDAQGFKTFGESEVKTDRDGGFNEFACDLGQAVCESSEAIREATEEACDSLIDFGENGTYTVQELTDSI